jgi:hypothetical protein
MSTLVLLLITGVVPSLPSIRDGAWATTPEGRLREDGAVWDLAFTPEGHVTQTDNMRNGTLEVYEGVWAAEADELALTLQVGDRELTLIYAYDLADDDLVLRRSSPGGAMAVVATFRRE